MVFYSKLLKLLRAGAEARARALVCVLRWAGPGRVGVRETLQVRPCKLRHRIHAVAGPAHPHAPAPDSEQVRRGKALASLASLGCVLTAGMRGGCGVGVGRVCGEVSSGAEA